MKNATSIFIIVSICCIILYGISNIDYGHGSTKQLANDLHKAMYMGDLKIVKHIIEDKGFDANGIMDQEYQERPIHEAAYYGRKEIIEYLLEHGADINSESSNGSCTALLISIWKKNEDLAIFLLQNGADPSIRTKMGGPYTGQRGISACTGAHREKMTRLIQLIPNCAVENWKEPDCDCGSR